MRGFFCFSTGEKMDYPVFLNMRGRLCVIIGGGAVGLRKARSLLAAGARVRLVAPLAPPSEDLPAKLEIVGREYRAGDLQGAFLAFAATADRAVNAAVVDEGRQRGVPVNVADVPDEGDFFLPARFSRGDLSVAVATGGKSPAFAVMARNYLKTVMGDDWAVFLDIAAAIRRKAQGKNYAGEVVEAALESLREKDLPGLIRCGRSRDIDVTLVEVLGSGWTLAELGISLAPKKE
jgi:precorrin-2 dehydrogenase/sirohydrochlorin ferrochelatase